MHETSRANARQRCQAAARALRRGTAAEEGHIRPGRDIKQKARDDE